MQRGEEQPMPHTIPEETLKRFASGTASEKESRTVLSHLLAGCGDCRRSLSRLGGFAETGEAAEYGPVLDRFESALARSLAAPAPAGSVETLLAELDRLPPRQQEMLAGNSRRYHHPALCEMLVGRSFSLRFRDPGECLRYARLGATIAGRLEIPKGATAAERAEIAALRCRSLAQLSSAQRLRGDLAAAEAALETAHGIVLGEGAPPDVVAEICEVSGALRCYQRRFTEAIAFYEGALAVYRDLGRPGEVARVLVGQAVARAYEGEPEAALGLLWEAFSKIGPGSPRMTLAACHALIYCLADAGRIEEAMLYWIEARPLYDRHGDPLIRVRGRWLEGKLMMVQGNYAAAARLLEGARRQYLDLGLSFDAAVLSLDLAPCHLVLGRPGEAGRLMRLAVPVFQALRIERELFAALRLLARSLEGFELAATG